MCRAVTHAGSALADAGLAGGVAGVAGSLHLRFRRDAGLGLGGRFFGSDARGFGRGLLLGDRLFAGGLLFGARLGARSFLGFSGGDTLGEDRFVDLRTVAQLLECGLLGLGGQRGALLERLGKTSHSPKRCVWNRLAVRRASV
ncbi:hypothetical protein WR25_23914 [Diploscapter pachys]|uniref:Uncharacterized protein n=1 Tax=Diploscapter pachys TaxID=2018661 RepID=A0A2A2M502_9BILA|nr:hypothetical protein WR25_23914 [Diploscapter pachys]